MLTVGLTGGIGSGKSAASRLFEQLGVAVIDADQVARDVVEPGEPALVAIQTEFGAEALDDAGQLNRRWLRQQVFDHPDKRRWLEALLHPLIRRQILNWLASHQQDDYVILSSPLLLETDQHQLTQAVVVVDLPEDIQLERSCQRDGMTAAAASKIIAAQMPRQQRVESADFILDNSGNLASLEAQVALLHQQLKSRAINKST
ncbi:dephospho-CoA kinase [Nitrincola iocasae]|uniref:Dephospho-CoA kinase n=1 Tax=Nitrincola iocasae TaxID=2614693 RepID=A0A5J6LGX5_9GAMM|nr:dephospho-CoA kinase [Nitrincola iocasae]QEW07441.1 dephospho-CoA kinase [Nitrincola iocasae]